MASKVYAISLRTHYRENIFQKQKRLLMALEPKNLIKPKSLWALKLHFGEVGSHAFMSPVAVRAYVDALSELGANCFLTDTNTLYVGKRSNAVDHLHAALSHGFGREVTGAPVVIADGLRGRSEVGIEVNRGGVTTAWLGKEFMEADGALILTHFKGHELTGFGGAIKNLGMGVGSRRGKLDQHSDLKPKVANNKCIGCAHCLSQCAHKAIDFLAAEKKAKIDNARCVGCAACIAICPEEAIDIPWSGDRPKLMRKMVEYANASLSGKEGRVLFVNYVGALSPLCDCVNHSDAPIGPDVGYLASTDPVALDLACAELVNQNPGSPQSCLPESALAPGADKWEALHPGSQWRFQLEYAAEIGLGSLAYDLEWLAEPKGVE